jgi:hypothetical protein
LFIMFRSMTMRPSLCLVTDPKPHRLGLDRPTRPFPTARAPGVVPTAHRSADHQRGVPTAPAAAPTCATYLPASTRCACSRRSRCSASSRSSSSQRRGKPHIPSPLHNNRRRVLAHSAPPLTVHLHSMHRALATAPPRHCPPQGLL